MGYPSPMFRTLVVVAHALSSLLRSRFDLAIENAALRQQLAFNNCVRHFPLRQRPDT
jgi:hypothetical protein